MLRRFFLQAHLVSLLLLGFSLYVDKATTPARAETLRVPADYPTVCEATAVAGYGDTVLVAPGIHPYRRVDCVEIPDGVVLTSEAGPEETILDAYTWGPEAGGLIVFAAGAGGATEVSGFTIYCHDIGGFDTIAIQCSPESQPTITTNLFRAHPSWPSAIQIGVWCEDRSSAIIANNTFVMMNTYVGNKAVFNGPLSSPTIHHNLIVGAPIGISCSSGSSPAISCNDFWDVELPYGSACVPGVNDFFEDPLFCDPDLLDYRLHSASPAVHGYGCGLVGALPVGCGTTAAEKVTWGSLRVLFR